MKKIPFKIFLLLGAIASTTLFGGSQLENKPRAQRVEPSFSFIDPHGLKDLHPYWCQALNWPESMASRIQPPEYNEVQGKKAIESSIYWLQKILKKDWIIDGSEIDIVPTVKGIDGKDAIRFRYIIGDYIFQILSLYPTMAIAIRPVSHSSHSEPLNKEEAEKYAIKMLEQFFNESKSIQENTISRVSKKGLGYFGASSGNSLPLDPWNKVASWWTDGNVFLFFCGKAMGNGRVPGHAPNWFSTPKTTNKAK